MLAPHRMMAAANAGGDGSFYGDLAALGLTANLKLCLDAGSADSYGGQGQSWLDLADGGYDLFRGATSGASSDDPTFNGAPGGLSSSEYFSFDGGDKFKYDSGTLPAWMDNLHQNNAAFTILVWIYWVATDRGVLVSGANAGASEGIHFNMVEPAGNKAVFSVLSGALTNKTGDTALTDNTWNLVGVSLDEAAGAGGSFLYLNGAYNRVAAANTFDGTYTSPGTGSTSLFQMGAFQTMTRPLGNGNRFAGVMIFEGAALTKANCDSIWNRQKGRFGL